MLFKKSMALLIAAAMITSSFEAVYAADASESGQLQNFGEVPPEKPEGEAPAEMRERPEGEAPAEMSEKPEGEAPAEIGEKPEGEAPAKMGERPEGESPAEMGERPEGNMQGSAEQVVSLPFKDISENDWYYEAVFKSYMMGLVSGTSDTEFSPKSQLTGGAVLLMLYRADGNSVSENSEGNWYDEAVEWANANSIITGEWSFDPAGALTREAMMKIIYNYLEYKGIDQSEEGSVSEFSDSDDVAEYALSAVKWLVGQDIVHGDEGRLRPNDTLTRAEMMYILMTVLDKYSLGTELNNGMRANPKENGMDGGAPDGMGDKAPGGFGSGSQTVDQGTAAATITEDGTYTDETYTSTGDDENALRVDGAAVVLDGITVNKDGGSSSNTETGDFYGMNAALLATDGANVTITNSTVNSSAQNGNGIFSYGSGTIVTVSDTNITTTADNSGGIQTTGGGTTIANNLTVNTSGSSAAAIRSDRGGGTVTVDGGSYTSNGYNSPAIYSTADITVSNAELTANNSEALVIEGKNSIELENCQVYGNMSDTKGTSSDENVHNVMIYQSMSGDADVGTSEFTMKGGTLTGSNGDMFYITNTHSIIKLTDVAIENNDTDSLFMLISGNSASRGWGSAGANGAQAELTADNQSIDGNIEVDTISTLDFSLENGTVLTGTINIVDNAQGGTAVNDNAVISIDSTSTWNLTGDCTITSLENKGTINYNGYTITLADGTVLNG